MLQLRRSAVSWSSLFEVLVLDLPHCLQLLPKRVFRLFGSQLLALVFPKSCSELRKTRLVLQRFPEGLLKKGLFDLSGPGKVFCTGSLESQEILFIIYKYFINSYFGICCTSSLVSKKCLEKFFLILCYQKLLFYFSHLFQADYFLRYFILQKFCRALGHALCLRNQESFPYTDPSSKISWASKVYFF